MRKYGFEIGLVLGNCVMIAVLLCAGAASPQKKYWQDQLAKPDQAWIEAYGYQGESLLAFNVRQLITAVNRHDQGIRRMAQEMLAMDKELKALTGDPNDTRPEVPQPGDRKSDKPESPGRDVSGVPEISRPGKEPGGQ